MHPEHRRFGAIGAHRVGRTKNKTEKSIAFKRKISLSRNENLAVLRSKRARTIIDRYWCENDLYNRWQWRRRITRWFFWRQSVLTSRIFYNGEAAITELTLTKRVQVKVFNRHTMCLYNNNDDDDDNNTNNINNNITLTMEDTWCSGDVKTDS